MGWRARIASVAIVAALAFGLLPEEASAHVANVEYRFPLPVWVFAIAGAAAVVLSVPAAALGVRGGRERASRDLYPFLAPLRLGTVGLVVAVLLFVVTLVAGFANPDLGFFNAAPLLFWVDFWVGLGIVSALVGNVFDFISPLSWLGRALDRRLAARHIPSRRYPEELGAWPAVALLITFSWMELVWEDGQKPFTVAVVLSVYALLQLVGMAVFGAEIWLARAELFTVLARTLARLAPLELSVAKPAGPCRAECCEEKSERIGCPACWLDAAPEHRRLRLRPYGVGVRREPQLGPGGSAFVVVLLATVVYDAVRPTTPYRELTAALIDLAPGFQEAETARGTVTMAIVLVALALLFPAAAALVARLEGSAFEDAVERYAPTLIPIVAVYFFAHYFLYFFSLVQLTPLRVLDPLGREWLPEYAPWTAVPGGLVWLIQAGVIVWGHLVAVMEAHRISLSANHRIRAALAAQAPLLALMVSYTFAGLWVLGQALQGEG